MLIVQRSNRTENCVNFSMDERKNQLSVGKKILWGGLGWVLGGPIGAIVGYSLAGITGQSMNSYGSSYQRTQYPQTQPGDFLSLIHI